MSHDERTCDVCGAPIAPPLRGYTQSLRACDAHLAEWLRSSERRYATLDAMAGVNRLPEVFAAWVAARKGRGGVRRRFAYTMGGTPLPEPVEVTADFQATSDRQPLFTDRYMEGDRAPDGTDISNRTRRKAWMQATGSADAGDFSPTFYGRARREREAPAPGLNQAIRDAYNRRK